MFSMTFGLGDRTPRYFPEDDCIIILEEDNIICNIFEEEISCSISEEEIIVYFED